MPHTIIDLPGEIHDENPNDFTEDLRHDDPFYTPLQSTWVLTAPPPLPPCGIIKANPNGTRDRMFKMLREKRL